MAEPYRVVPVADGRFAVEEKLPGKPVSILKIHEVKGDAEGQARELNRQNAIADEAERRGPGYLWRE